MVVLPAVGGGAEYGVNLFMEIWVFYLHKNGILGDPAGLDATFVAHHNAAEPVITTPVHRPNLDIIANAHHPNRPVAVQRAIRAQSRDLQFIRCFIF
jgi:hypothetical protein